MLEELHVRNFALIEEAWLEFGPGMTVLTGETGAGKTALVGAIKLLLGERADSQMVRAGAEETVVEGRIRLVDDEIVVRRRVSADGRSRCTIDESMVSVGALADRMGPLFDLHGQHEHQSLLHAARHVDYLDRYIGVAADEALEAYAAARREYDELSQELEGLDERLTEDARQADYLRFVAEEIARAAPEEDEDERLEARLPHLRHGGRLIEAAAEAHSSLGDDGAACDLVARASAVLSRVDGLDPVLDELHRRLDEASIALGDLAVSIRDYGEGIDHDPRELNVVEARLSALAELKKKHGPTLRDVISVQDEAVARLEALERGESGRGALEKRIQAARSAVEEAEARVTALRRDAGGPFVERLGSEVVDLGMRGTRFDVSFEQLEFDVWTSGGGHRVEFLFAAGPEQPLRPLSKIASGGEISRVMLALKTVLGTADSVPILVFDEVDAGIGGATATAVGRRLSALAERHQVLVVTHLAQVAAFAQQHLVVEKSVGDEHARTEVRRVEGDDRVMEISRMLSGGDSQVGRAHAEELLASVSTPGAADA